MINSQMINSNIEVLSDSQIFWKKLSLAEKQKILKLTYSRLVERKNEAAKLITEEMGKPITESVAEIEKCLKTIQRCCDDDFEQLKSREIKSVYQKSIVVHEPLGVIYSIMPWNFPLWQAVRMIYPTLLAGNTILLKHSEITKGMGDFIEDLFDGIWTKKILKHLLVPHDFTEKIIAHPSIGGVSLTGSTGAGKTISELAGKYFKKFVLELGGSDPYIVFNDANLAQAAKTIAAARLMNTGQSCICAKRCLVEESALEKFLALLKDEFNKSVYGDPSKTTTTLGPLAHPKFVKSLEAQLQDLEKNTEAKLVFQKPHGQDPIKFVDSRIYVVEKNSAWFCNQEFFAPILLVFPFVSEDQAIELANSTEFALGAGIWSTDLDKAQNVAAQILAGQVVINDQVKSDYSLPFGGFKSSGMGRELGMEGFLEFTQTKVISM